MEVKNTIYLGYKGQEPVKLQWRNSNGILIAGIPGTGKSQTMSFYLSEFVYNGAKLILCDYNAASGLSQTLLDRVQHLEDAFLLPPATTSEEIVSYITYIKELGDRRYRAIEKNHYPIVFVIDEFAAFVLDYSPAEITTTKISGDKRSDEGEQRIVERQNSILTELISCVLKYRKVNIRFMLAGQEWAQMSTSGIRALRSNITHKIYHRMDDAQANLFGLTAVNERRVIRALPVGHVYYEGEILKVPLLTDTMIDEVIDRIGQYERISAPELKELWTPQDQAFLDEMLKKYVPKLTDRYLQQIPFDTKEDVMKIAIKKGKSMAWVEDMLKGRTETLRNQYKTLTMELEHDALEKKIE